MLYDWDYLLVNSNVQKNIEEYSELSDYKDQLIRKFKDGVIRTKKLNSNESLFSLRLDRRARVICKPIEYGRKKGLLILEILPLHEYDKSKYLNGSKTKDDKETLQVVAVSQEVKAKDIELENKPDLPKVTYTCINDQIIILSKDQLDVLKCETYQPTAFTVNGVAGSGKTTIAELLLYKSQEEKRSILYIAKSEELVKKIRKQCENSLKDEQQHHIEYHTYENLIAKNLNKSREDIFDQNKFIEWVQNRKRFKDHFKKEKVRIANEIYEDIRKLHDKRLFKKQDKPGKRESYGHDISDDISSEYKQYLNFGKIVDLSMIETINPIDKEYDYIIIDEAQDFGKSELYHIKKFLNQSGSIYFFMDSNQSLTDDFNLISQYINDVIGKMEKRPFSLKHGYRTTKDVTGVANKILEMKRQLIGGSLNKDTYRSMESTCEAKGTIKWIDKDSEEKDATIIDTLKKNAKESLDIAVIIPDDSKDIRSAAEEMFRDKEKLTSDVIILSPQEIKGLEFKQVVLFNFFSGEYAFNCKNDKKFSTLEQNSDSQNRSKDSEEAKNNAGKYAKFMNNLFVSVTRTTSDLFFIETGKSSKASAACKTKFNEYFDQGDNNLNHFMTIWEMVERIEESQELSITNFIKSCRTAYNKIKQEIESDGQQSNFTYLKRIQDAITNHQDKQDKEAQNFLKELKGLLSSVQSDPLNNIQNKEQDKEIETQPTISSALQNTKNDKGKTAELKSIQQNKNKRKKNTKPQEKNEEVSTEEVYKITNVQDVVNVINDPSIPITSKTLEQKLFDGATVLCWMFRLLYKQSKDKKAKWIQRILGCIPKITNEALEAPDKEGNSALYWLIRSEVLILILASWSQIKDENLIQQFETLIKKFTKKGVNRIGPDGWSPLHNLHLGHDNSTLLSILQEYNKELFTLEEVWKNRYKESSNLTALHVSARFGDVDEVKYLLSNGACILSKAEKDKSTALHVAAEYGHVEIIECLLGRLLDEDKIECIKATTKMGCTALYLAAQNGHEKAIDCLLGYLSRGEKLYLITAPTEKGSTALHLAVQNGYVKTVTCLLSHLPESEIAYVRSTFKSFFKYASKEQKICYIKFFNDPTIALDVAKHAVHMEFIKSLLQDLQYDRAQITTLYGDPSQNQALNQDQQHQYSELIDRLTKDLDTNVTSSSLEEIVCSQAIKKMSKTDVTFPN